MGRWPAALPADFLVDEQGVIRQAYYGEDIGDHLPFEAVRSGSGVRPGEARP